MITVEEALTIINENLVDFGTEKISLDKSLNRVLKENLKTDRDLPPYDRVTMDGIAIQYEEFVSGKVSFPIEDIAAAGMPRKRLSSGKNCLEVMTGSIMPLNCDTVIRYEDLKIKDQTATIIVSNLSPKQNIHYKGEDRKSKELIVAKDTIISSAEIGVAASIGKSDILVSRLPRTLVISTGDELVPINAIPLDHQIRRSNVYRIVTSLLDYGIQADNKHLNDDEEEITRALKVYLENYDVLILSGGVSKGKFDFLPRVLEKVGVKKLFHRIKQRPGKPFWFGKYRDKCTIFALPGNPVSSFLCMHRYFNYWLHSSLNSKISTIPCAELTRDVQFKPDLTYFLEVKIKFNNQGKILATPVKGNGSGDLANLVDADAFIELPRGKEFYTSGEVYPVYFYRKLSGV
jgi:molybdopterin molybdotransferase